MTERQLTKLMLDYLKWVPNSSFKKIRGSMGMKGILDIIGCWEGKYVELEVKTEKGRLTLEQSARIEEIRQAGGIAEEATGKAKLLWYLLHVQYPVLTDEWLVGFRLPPHLLLAIFVRINHSSSFNKPFYPHHLLPFHHE